MRGNTGGGDEFDDDDEGLGKAFAAMKPQDSHKGGLLDGEEVGKGSNNLNPNSGSKKPDPNKGTASKPSPEITLHDDGPAATSSLKAPPLQGPEDEDEEETTGKKRKRSGSFGAIEEKQEEGKKRKLTDNENLDTWEKFWLYLFSKVPYGIKAPLHRALVTPLTGLYCGARAIGLFASAVPVALVGKAVKPFSPEKSKQIMNTAGKLWNKGHEFDGTYRAIASFPNYVMSVWALSDGPTSFMLKMFGRKNFDDDLPASLTNASKGDARAAINRAGKAKETFLKNAGNSSLSPFMICTGLRRAAVAAVIGVPFFACAAAINTTVGFGYNWYKGGIRSAIDVAASSIGNMVMSAIYVVAPNPDSHQTLASALDPCFSKDSKLVQILPDEFKPPEAPVANGETVRAISSVREVGSKEKATFTQAIERDVTSVVKNFKSFVQTAGEVLQRKISPPKEGEIASATFAKNNDNAQPDPNAPAKSAPWRKVFYERFFAKQEEAASARIMYLDPDSTVQPPPPPPPGLDIPPGLNRPGGPVDSVVKSPLAPPPGLGIPSGSQTQPVGPPPGLSQVPGAQQGTDSPQVPQPGGVKKPPLPPRKHL